MSARLPFHEIFQVLQYIFRHNSIIKIDKLRDNYATVASIASCGAAWIYVATQNHHYSTLGKRIDHLEQERRKTRNVNKPPDDGEEREEALHQTTTTTTTTAASVIASTSALSVNTASLLAPTAFACASVFIGSYLFARSRTHARLLRQWQLNSVSTMPTRLKQSGTVQTQRGVDTRIQIERTESGHKTHQKMFKEFDQISIT